MPKLKFSILLVFFTIFWSKAGTAFVCPSLGQDILAAMNSWHVPGIAIGILHENGTTTQSYFGFSNPKKRTRTAPNTIFALGSLTKSFTALGLASQETKGGIPLTTPIKKFLSFFPDNINFFHLLSHTSGWPRHDALWYLNKFTRTSLIKRLSLLPRIAMPGKVFQYNNIPFSAAASAYEIFKGQNWHNWISEVLLKPASMNKTYTRFLKFKFDPNRASPHFPSNHGETSLPLRNTDPVAPAAGIYSNIMDMLRYLKLLSNGGKIDGKQIVPSRAIEKIQIIRTPGWGLGFRIDKWHEQKLVFHSGFIDGYSSRLSLLPTKGMGVIVLSNMSGKTPVTHIISLYILDCLLNKPRVDWLSYFGKKRPWKTERKIKYQIIPEDRSRSFYTGVFVNPAYGKIKILESSDLSALRGTFHGRNFKLTYTGNDNWRLNQNHWPLREGLLFSFSNPIGNEFLYVKAAIADGPTYRYNAGPLLFKNNKISDKHFLDQN